MTGNNDATKVKGKVKEKAGWLAGDRDVEAKGKVEAEKGKEPSEREQREAIDEVRADHDDI
jgi:uncharacterized protein YjbJ (UPF0337 family)